MLSTTTVGDFVAFLTQGSGHEWRAGGNQTDFDEWFSRLCRWPPNVFAVMAAILHESGLYRVAPEKVESSSARSQACHWTNALYEKVRAAEAPWSPNAQGQCCESLAQVELPSELVNLGGRLWESFSHPIAPDDRNSLPALRQDLLFLHYLADEACCGIGTPRKFRDWRPVVGGTRQRSPGGDGDSPLWPSLSHRELDDAVARLCASGTLSCFEPTKIRILPKKHTPQVGITLRSVSLWVGAVRGEVKVNWYAHERGSETPTTAPTSRALEPAAVRKTPDERRSEDNTYLTNLLLVPWPFELKPGAFSVCYPAGYQEFEYHPPAFGGPQVEESVAYMSRLLAEATRMGCKVDGVIFPEQALDDVGFRGVVRAVSVAAPNAFVLAGVRASNDGQPTNEAWLAVEGRPDPMRQEKHHRWCLDAAQIRQYHLGARFLATEGRRYWERMRIMPRSISVAHLRQRLTLCYLICEDLARVEPVAEVVRAVGPNLVVALLLDGPQLEKRWPGRYASIFADDPGSSVLTLSSLGMVRRSVPPEGKPSTVVGLWKDPRTGTRELPMDVNAQALLLSLATNTITEYTFDGRNDGGNTGALTFAGLNEIRIS